VSGRPGHPLDPPLLTLLVGREEGHTAFKNLEWWGAGVVVCLERGADLHVVQIGFTFLVPAHPGSPAQRAVKRVCVYSLIDTRRSDFSSLSSSVEQIANSLNKFSSVIIVLTLFFQALAFLIPGIQLDPEDISSPCPN